TSFEGDALRLELRRPPHVAARGSPLAGIRVFLDPGHMPSAPGAIGPLGVKEMDVNYAIARQAAELLRREGAIALLSRSNPDDEVSLVERPRLALEQKADVLVSIHNNFLSPEADPFHGQPHGYSVFYYYPHSLRLAQDIYAAYQRDVPLPGEDLRFGDLLVCRLSAMPAVLTESAYLSYPRQERLLLKPDFRETIARAVVDGLRAYFQRFREKSPEAR
ncbi:MAG: N-acetylmuramoyl-L-alanine amidase, partial [Elusimicrobia bacterium]|nr:N-acetylmuramoyl-L-alanine amidase [Elusimicrobiota bacterium]